MTDRGPDRQRSARVSERRSRSEAAEAKLEADGYQVAPDGTLRRGWPDVRVVISPSRSGVSWMVSEQRWRGANRYSTLLSRGRVAVDAEVGLRQAFEEAWYQAMMAVPEVGI